MNIRPLSFIRALASIYFCCSLAQAGVIGTFSDFLTAADPTQTGRLSRNGIPQDWTGGELFPGVINTSTTYNYQVYSLNVGDTPYIQIEIDSLSPNTFLSAYDGSYSPNSAAGPNFGFDTNWLGDAGTSGNSFGTDPLFFQVFVPSFDNLILVVNQTSAGTAGLGNTNPFNITVEGFIDSDYTDAPSTPEPAAIVLFTGGLGIITLAGYRRRRRA